MMDNPQNKRSAETPQLSRPMVVIVNCNPIRCRKLSMTRQWFFAIGSFQSDRVPMIRWFRRLVAESKTLLKVAWPPAPPKSLNSSSLGLRGRVLRSFYWILRTFCARRGWPFGERIMPRRERFDGFVIGRIGRIRLIGPILNPHLRLLPTP